MDSFLQEKNSGLSEVKGQKSHPNDIYITAFLPELNPYEIYIKTQISWPFVSPLSVIHFINVYIGPVLKFILRHAGDTKVISFLYKAELK